MTNRSAHPALASHADEARAGDSFDARVKLACLVAYVVVTLHARTPVSMGLCVVAAIAMATAARLDVRAVTAAIRPLAVVLLLTAVMQVLYIQQGPVLVQVGPVAVTQGALAAAATMVIGLACVTVASVAFMRGTPTDQLVSTLDWLLGPLRALGVRTGAFTLALAVAFRFLPVFVDEFRQLKCAQVARCASFDGGVRERVSAYARLIPPLVRSSFHRSDRLAEAFASRCFTGFARTTLHPQRVRPRDCALLAATAAFAVAAFIC